MKKIISILLAVIILSACIPAFADGYSDKLDLAFENSKLNLVSASFPLVTAEAFVFPNEMWEALGEKIEAEDPAAEIAAAIQDVEFDWLSLSPSGNSGILMGGNIAVCYYNGEYRILYPSATRGVEDVNGNLAKVYSMNFKLLLSDAGVIYSPDGRYAAVYNIKYTLMLAKFILDPIIIDLSTGEMILTATYGNKIREGNAGAVTTAVFSADGNYLYYMMYCNITEYRTALYRYNLKTMQTELCYSGNSFNYYPALSQTESDALIIIKDTQNINQNQGLTQITYENMSWTSKDVMFDLSSKYWSTDRLLFSDNSGYALLLGKGKMMESLYYSFSIIKPDEDFSGINQYYAISKSNNEVLSFTAEDIISVFDKASAAASDTTRLMLNLPFRIIIASAISPDGHYALLLTAYREAKEPATLLRQLCLVSLDDLTVKEVTGVNPSDMQVGALASGYASVIEWNTNTLIIGTTDGIRGYKFELD